MRKIKNFKGVTGSIEFDNKGDPVKAKYFVLQFDKQAYPGKVVKVIEQQAPAAAKKLLIIDAENDSGGRSPGIFHLRYLLS